MIVLLIVLIVFFLVIVFLYAVGKRVKRAEFLQRQAFSRREANRRLAKYKRKSTPKVPTIDK